MSKVSITPISLIPAEDCYKLDGEIIKGIYQRIKREIKKFNELQTYLRDKIRGTFFASIKTILNDAVKLAKTGTLIEACKVQLSNAMLANYMEQSPDTAKRHIERMLHFGFLKPAEPTEQEKAQLKGRRRFNKLYNINLEFLTKFLNPTPSAPAPTTPDGQPTTPAASPQAPSSAQPNANTTMTVVHNTQHSTCEQVEKQQNNAIAKCNNAMFSPFSFHRQVFAKCLILNLLNFRITPLKSANCVTHLAVEGINIWKTSIRAVDMWISVREGEHRKTVEKLTLETAFTTRRNVAGHLERFGARAARRAA